MNALSLFNGISGLHCALDRAEIKTGTVYYSEIDKFANQVTQHHYPQDVALGDVTKWQEWGLDWASIDLLVGGSPCQGFSVAGKQGGTKAVLNGVEILVSDRETYLDMKAKGADFLSQSHLFWEYILILDHIRAHNPNVRFLLENVKMKKELLEMIDDAIGAKSVVINSALVSAQNRLRHYWCNWEVTQPEDRGVLLRDVLEKGTHKERPCERIKDSNDGHIATATDIKGMDCIKRVYGQDGKAPTLTTMGGGHREPKVLCSDVLYPDATAENKRNEAAFIEHSGMNATAMKNGKSYCVTANCGGAWAKHSATKKVRTMAAVGFTQDTDVMTSHNQVKYRKLTPLECERLQTLPDNFTSMLSNTQRYKSIGNGWTIDVIVHILKCMSL